ncbi:PilY1 beta-propeller domain-containing protein OS=Stutzerimonas stutzeri OX=316 GN=UF78_03760 PE=3 SV=1 [Stutzerimonas stutzeri]
MTEISTIPTKMMLPIPLQTLLISTGRKYLRSGIGNKVPTYLPFDTSDKDPRNNPANWQHMVNFTVGLGLSNSLQLNTAPTWGGTTFANHSELMNMAANGKRWPTVSNNNDNNVYDLWHAAINSRGEFFSADSPDRLVNAFSNILSRIAERTTSAASPAINSGMQEDATDALVSFAYQTSYSSNESWAGDLKAYKKEKLLNGATGQNEIQVSEEWSARNKLASKSWSSRNIMIASASGADKLQKFEWSNAGVLNPGVGEDKTLAYWLRQNPDDGDTLESASNTLAADRLKFIRGERTHEESKFRKRHTVLGDMIASKPATVRGARYLTSYANRIEGVDSKYGEFVTNNKSRSPRIYVGANDGMLHGFNAVTGEETFAFIPTAIFPKLHKLTGKNYEGAHHQFYVDGSPVIADVYIDKKWKTVLIGTLRAGGKGLFALDVTEPDDIKLLWEFGEEQLPASDHEVQLGYSFPQPTVARLHNGKWAVVTGNGYEASSRDNGKAALLLIDIASGDLIKSIEVQGEDGVANGLSTPKLVDMNTDGLADYAYAGDLQGNLWRFTLSPDNNPDIEPFKRAEDDTFNGFKASFGGKALFKAISNSGSLRQPITAAPSILRHPSGYGNLVVFGTGKYFEEGDKSGITGVQQSIYGIWDTSGSKPKNNSLHPSGLTRSKLQAQVMESSKENVTNSRDARTLSQNSVQWATPPSSSTGAWSNNAEDKYGWYFDLVLDREMMIENMNQLGQTILFQTLLPSNDPCSSGVENWTYAINPYTGGRTQHHVFVDFRSSENSDTVISAIRQDGEGGITIGQRPDNPYEACTGLECIKVIPDPSSIGRQSWRKVEDI